MKETYKGDKYARITFLLIGFTLLSVIVGVIVATAQNSQDDVKIKDTLAKGVNAKNISLSASEKQPFLDILNKFQSALTRKQLAETQMELEQKNLELAVEKVKKVKGCEGCGFDIEKLELIVPPSLPVSNNAGVTTVDPKTLVESKKDEKKKEVKP